VHFLVTCGDQFAAQIVNQIMQAAFWTSGNNAIVVTFDEGVEIAAAAMRIRGRGRL
jgi:hypothetical protein